MRLYVPVACMADMLARFCRGKGFGGPLTRAGFVDPQVAHDPIYPAVEAGAGLPLVARLERPLQRGLAQIVAIGTIARQAGGKAPQPGQDRQQIMLERHRASNHMFRG